MSLSTLRALVVFILVPAFSCTDKPKAYTETGEASFYARMLEGKKTANGDIYTKDKLTAAHNHLPLGTIIKVTNLDNSKMVEVEVNDRGPYAKGRILDLSRSAAKELGMMESGTANIQLEVIKAAPGYSISDSVVVN